MISVQFCGLALVLVCLLLTLRTTRLNIYSERIFVNFLICDIFFIASDIMSYYAIMYSDKLNIYLIHFTGKLYLVFLVVLIWMTTVYTFACFDDLVSYLHIHKRYIIELGVVCFILILLPISYHVDVDSMYSTGVAVVFAYVVAIYCLVHNLFLTVQYKDRLPLLRRRLICLWIAFWIVAILIQFFNLRIYLVGYASALGLAILFFELESPAGKLDKTTGFFNFNVLSDYLRYLCILGVDYTVVELGVLNRGDGVLDEELEVYKLKIQSVLRKYRRSKKLKVFKYNKNKYVIVSSVRSQLDNLILDLNSLDNYIKPSYIMSEGCKELDEIDEFIAMFMDYSDSIMDNQERGAIKYIGSNDYDKLKHVKLIKRLILSAIANDRVEVYLQPIYSTVENSFTSAEVLTRLKREDGSIVPPNEFIPIAEETGLILKLEDVIFEKAVKFFNQEHLKDLGIHYIEVNLSVKNGESTELVNKYTRILNENNVSHDSINLEITETASVDSKLKLIENMSVLLKRGISFSLDDFGSGASNLNYVIDMPVNILKFDKDITDSYFKNEKAKSVMTSAIDMAHNLGLKVVVEGVETEVQLNEMKRLGVEYIQGYYFSKPLPTKEFLDFIKKNNKGDS